MCSPPLAQGRLPVRCPFGIVSGAHARERARLPHTQTYTHYRTHTHTHSLTHTHTHTRAHTHTRKHAHARTCTHMHAHARTCTHMHARIYTRARTHTPRSHAYACTHAHNRANGLQTWTRSSGYTGARITTCDHEDSLRTKHMISSFALCGPRGADGHAFRDWSNICVPEYRPTTTQIKHLECFSGSDKCDGMIYNFFAVLGRRVHIPSSIITFQLYPISALAGEQ